MSVKTGSRMKRRPSSTYRFDVLVTRVRRPLTSNIRVAVLTKSPVLSWGRIGPACIQDWCRSVKKAQRVLDEVTISRKVKQPVLLVGLRDHVPLPAEGVCTLAAYETEMLALNTPSSRFTKGDEVVTQLLALQDYCRQMGIDEVELVCPLMQSPRAKLAVWLRGIEHIKVVTSLGGLPSLYDLIEIVLLPALLFCHVFGKNDWWLQTARWLNQPDERDTVTSK